MNNNSYMLVLSSESLKMKENKVVEHMNGTQGGAVAGASLGMMMGGPIGAAIGATFGAGIGAAVDAIFGGSSTSLSVEQEIENLVKSTQSSMVNLITQSIVNISHKIVQEQIATVTNNIDSRNQIDASQIIISNGADFSVDQQNSIKQTVQAILNLTQSSELVTKISSMIKNDIATVLSQNADLSNKVAATSSLLRASKSSGELNAAVDGIKNVLKDVSDMGSVRKDNTTIKNNILNSVTLDASSKADINDYVNTMIKQTIEQKTLNQCVQNTEALNQIYLNNILVEGKNSSFEVIQGNILDAFYECIITSLLSSQNIQNISTETLNSTSASLKQGAKVSNDLAASDKKEDISKSSSYLDNPMGIAILIIIIVVIGIAYFSFK
jgi:hypothetical protein